VPVRPERLARRVAGRPDGQTWLQRRRASAGQPEKRAFLPATAILASDLAWPTYQVVSPDEYEIADCLNPLFLGVKASTMRVGAMVTIRNAGFRFLIEAIVVSTDAVARVVNLHPLRVCELPGLTVATLNPSMLRIVPIEAMGVTQWAVFYGPNTRVGLYPTKSEADAYVRAKGGAA
jgi:hypothetical protein